MTVCNEYLLPQIAKRHTFESRIFQLAEECGELVQACMKTRRTDVNSERAMANLCEEMADVWICLEELRMKLEPADRALFDTYVRLKIEREAQRVGVGACGSETISKN